MTDPKTLVERVARAIYETSRPFVLAGNDDVPGWSEGQRKIWETIAVSAIAATEIEHLQSQVNATTEALAEARTKLKHNVACLSHWDGLPRCDCATRELLSKIDTALKTVGSMG